MDVVFSLTHYKIKKDFGDVKSNISTAKCQVAHKSFVNSESGAYFGRFKMVIVNNPLEQSQYRIMLVD